ncbi:MAG TPA: outer membrane lipoprotein LolB [Gammaproteobacteria bacterium]|nr:outer membrane lipoprotein LolB [Gammaproteobacteria bacterium]
MARLVLLAVILCAQIAACSTSPKQIDLNQTQRNAAWIKHKSELDSIKHWQLQGRFSAQNETESWHGSIQWSQDQNQFAIHISGPLNSGSFSLHGNARSATLELAKDKIFQAPDPELLLETYTNLRLPVKNLRYWVIGLPSPDSDTRSTLNKNGLLGHLSQKNWEISFKNYQKINNLRLPNKIFLENHEFDVRLVIKNWQISS